MLELSLHRETLTNSFNLVIISNLWNDRPCGWSILLHLCQTKQDVQGIRFRLDISHECVWAEKIVL